ncbi:hypothetical protein [Bradyrhizobium sp. AC87j1]|uniref:hypothetical protein n=1 Tax=Bradyrhizobium sp. AC87j1 TaxID=2055894 RepID=UPI001375254D|nr:hypothetical protein [Bradyrhizobium sp. AC87j1]
MLQGMQDTDGGVIAMMALGREHMAFDQVEERHDGEDPAADLVGSVNNGRSIPSHLTRTLAVEQDMHAHACHEAARSSLPSFRIG